MSDKISEQDNQQPQQQQEVVEDQQQQQTENVEVEGIPIEDIHKDPNVDNAFADASNFNIVTKTETSPTSDIVNDSNKKLSKRIHCRRCECIIILPNNASLVEKEIALLNQKGSDSAELLKYMWFLPDMFQFENIAFSKDVKSQYKYLTCAECESEIIGVHYIQSKENYISHDRVVYK
ncbi:Mss4-like family protein [Heterostelium album PN500]|uniref:Mss4-like family protein n=1 Tax=Heterostelium pallidum (strain ATCC 26659 / Pp 5 / PN500) TaxID=670386 RepID=D3BCT6_HETP5|nr:Mss4-like family protein [Heterostelium album PN500]EFA80728.1 Mss4-like family protein [Heterostelium album PN500]|eukprot:XP_020432848.1 Mss4-like family protein [Heterostelium album PN500]